MGVVPILNSPAGTYINTISSFCDVRVAPTPNVGEGAGVEDGTIVGAGAGVSDETMVAIGAFVAEGITGATVARGATVGDGVACLGKKSEQAIEARSKERSEMCICDLVGIRSHYIP
jgi:hypothetical protein